MVDKRTSAPLRITGLMPQADDDSMGDRRWKSASVRIRCVEIAPYVGALGATVKLVESSLVQKRIADGSFFDADVYVIYQTLEDHREVVSTLLEAGKCVVTDVCDDVTQYPGVLGLTWDNARRAHAITVPTRSLADRLGAQIDTPIHVIPDAVEGTPQPVRPPRTEGPLRLFWYGWQHKVSALAARLPELARLAERRRIALGLMTNVDPVGPALQSVLDASTERLTIRVTPWQLAAFNATMSHADIAIMPYIDRVSYSGRSPVRLVQALWLGRLAIAEDVEGYPEFERFGLLHRSLADGVAWAIEHPETAMGALNEARRYVAQTHHPQVLARQWLDALTEIHQRFVADRNGA